MRLNYTMVEKIEKFLDKACNQPVRYISRASNMLCLGLGEFTSSCKDDGNNYKKSKFTLHVQTSWRIVNKDSRRILLAMSDFYVPNSTLNRTRDFIWDKSGNNLFDEKSINWISVSKPIYVKSFKMDLWGDLFLYFSNGDVLEVFVNSSDNTESWRFFETESNKKHLVVTGFGFSFE